MDNALIVSMYEPVGDVQDNGQNLFDLQRLPGFKLRAKIAAIGKFENEITTTRVCAVHVCAPYNVGMTQLHGQLQFAEKGVALTTWMLKVFDGHELPAMA